MSDPLMRYLELVLATAQAGLTFSTNHFDIERFNRLRTATAQLLEDSGGFEASTIKSWIKLDSGYPTPKLDVRALIFDESQRVMLVLESEDNCWTLPGGWCDIGESPKEAIEREVLEEAGLVCNAVRLLAMFDKHKHPHPPQMPHAHKVFFLCESVGGSLLQATPETHGARFFPVGALPTLSQHRVLEAQIQTLAERVYRGDLPALFD